MNPRRWLAALLFVACAGAAQGCELVADFDRSKIPGPDASVDAAIRPPDAGDEDAGATDDAGASAADDAGADDAG